MVKQVMCILFRGMLFCSKRGSVEDKVDNNGGPPIPKTMSRLNEATNQNNLPYSTGGSACSVALARISLSLMDFGRANEAL